MKNKILKKDSKFIWHPFTQEKSSDAPILVKKAKDEKIIDIDGNEYIDLISSWWVNTHGHCREEIIKEISDQAKSIEQVLFAGFTHEPAVNLAEKLVGLLPDKLNKVFFSDNGSTSVEIAMKVAIQYWYNKGKKKNKFMAFDGGYHGDTLGAMSVGFSSGFYEPFKEIINKNFFFNFPENWFGNNQVELSEKESNEDFNLDDIYELDNNENPIKRDIEYYKNFLDWGMDGEQNSLCDDVIEWLKKNIPSDSNPNKLCWGDSRLGNVLYKDYKATALLDWEMSSIGDPVSDLAWGFAVDDASSLGLGVKKLKGSLSSSEAIDIWEKNTNLSSKNYKFYRIFSLLKFSIIMIRVAKKLMVNNIIELEKDFYKNNYISNFLEKEFKQI